MKLRKEDLESLKKLFSKRYSLSNRARFHYDLNISRDHPVRSDLSIEEGKRKIFIEFAHTASWGNLSHLLLIRELAEGTVEMGLAAKVVPDSIKSASVQMKIPLIYLPDDIHTSKEEQRPRGKLTSTKAWAVVVHLLKSGPTSIRSISRKENISYGWVHNVVTYLISREIVIREKDLVSISDHEGLFNAVAWERPLGDLEEFEVRTSFDSTHDLSRTLTDWSERRNSRSAICAYNAATLHFGKGIRSDLVYCYVEDEKTRNIIHEEFSSQKEGIRLKVLRPDRDVFQDSILKDSTRITSLSQTILDVAGLGYAGKDLLQEMMDQYGTDRT